MIGKNTIKWVHSLEMKKNRKREHLFVAEGPKVVGDLLAHYRPRAVFATAEWNGRASLPSYVTPETVSDDELRRLSFLHRGILFCRIDLGFLLDLVRYINLFVGDIFLDFYLLCSGR